MRQHGSTTHQSPSPSGARRSRYESKRSVERSPKSPRSTRGQSGASKRAGTASPAAPLHPSSVHLRLQGVRGQRAIHALCRTRRACSSSAPPHRVSALGNHLPSLRAGAVRGAADVSRARYPLACSCSASAAACCVPQRARPRARRSGRGVPAGRAAKAGGSRRAATQRRRRLGGPYRRGARRKAAAPQRGGGQARAAGARRGASCAPSRDRNPMRRSRADPAPGGERAARATRRSAAAVATCAEGGSARAGVVAGGARHARRDRAARLSTPTPVLGLLCFMSSNKPASGASADGSGTPITPMTTDAAARRAAQVRPDDTRAQRRLRHLHSHVRERIMCW